eukprot:gnl/TRDRNA2_/TRDRNA2_32582_c0_seq1.p1 gnl/TRDRNA2_/TRDRNA2_32582_c0~~gnl/TRDRNA2_/TRDRNA2_32582_c0_seq1.p1  ORF type:complete len:154 (+),score=19.00 gnl/TRDRNA2_/TRDRNA2_32582_c0_seq1:600-1061(+)
MLARQQLGNVYAVHFFSPLDSKGCFDLLYRAQMAALYPLGRCLSSVGPDVGFDTSRPSAALCAAVRVIFSTCDVDADGIWLEDDWIVFWRAVYARLPSDSEKEALERAELIGASEERVLRWFVEMMAQGRGDSLWTCLRAFGYNGALLPTKSA